MKTTINQIYARQYRASMREHAMSFRENVHPDEWAKRFSDRVERGALYLRLAISQRNLALAREKMDRDERQQPLAA